MNRVNWGYAGWISRMRKEEPVGQKEKGVISRGQKDTVKCFLREFGLPRWVHHSLGFDTLSLVVLAFSVYQMLTVKCYTCYHCRVQIVEVPEIETGNDLDREAKSLNDLLAIKADNRKSGTMRLI